MLSSGANRTSSHDDQVVAQDGLDELSDAGVSRKRPARSADIDPHGNGSAATASQTARKGTTPSRPTSPWQRWCPTTSLQGSRCSAGEQLPTLRTTPPDQSPCPTVPHHPRSASKSGASAIRVPTGWRPCARYCPACSVAGLLTRSATAAGPVGAGQLGRSGPLAARRSP